MSKLLVKTEFVREPGMLYFVKSDETGRLCVYEAELSRGGRGKGNKNKK